MNEQEKSNDRSDTPLPMAFLLAGGRGTRLKPLTDHCPKPLLPVGGKPIILHILEDLALAGVKKAVILTGYMGDMLEKELKKAELPLELLFQREKEPLGSAGCVGAARAIAEENFFVICADAYGKRDYRGFYKSHLEKGATASLILTKVCDPGEYGLVLTDREGRVQSFSEKPSWSEAFTDMANTGIYLFNKTVLDLIPEKSVCDFGKDVFPTLMAKKEKVYGFYDGGFWCDIGTKEAYLHCNLRENNGKSLLMAGVVAKNARIENSLLFEDVCVGSGSVINGAIISKGCIIKENCRIAKGCFLGEGCVLEEHTVLPENTCLPAGTKIKKSKEHLFSPKEDLPSDLRPFFTETVLTIKRASPAFARALGRAIGKALKEPGAVGLMYNGEESAEKLVDAMAKGLSPERQPVFFGKGFYTCAAFCACQNTALTVLWQAREGTGYTLTLFDKNGFPPSAAFIRAVRDAYIPEIPEEGHTPTLTALEQPGKELYVRHLLRLCPEGLSGMNISIGAGGEAEALLGKVLLTLGATLTLKKENTVGSSFCRGQASPPPHLLSLRLSPNGERSTLAEEEISLDFFHLSALLLGEELRTGKKISALPFRAPSVFFKIAKAAGSAPAGFPMCPADGRYDRARQSGSSLRYLFDGLEAILGVLALMKKSGKSLRELNALLPRFSVAEGGFDCAEEEKLSCLLSVGATPSGEGLFKTTGGGRLSLRALGGRGLSLSAEAAEDADARRLLADLKKELQKNQKR